MYLNLWGGISLVQRIRRQARYLLQLLLPLSALPAWFLINILFWVSPLFWSWVSHLQHIYSFFSLLAYQSVWLVECKSLTCHQHHHVLLPAQISLTLSCHPSSFAPGKPSRLHPVSSQSSCIVVLAGRPAFARPFEGDHRSMSLMSSSLLLQQFPTCLIRLTLVFFVMGGRWPCSCYFVGRCL